MAWQPDYATAAQLKSYVGIREANLDEAEIALAITASSRAIDRACNRQFGLVDAVEDRYYTPRWDKRLCRWVIEIDDLMTTTGLLVNADLDDDATYDDTIDQYALKPVNSAPKGRPWTQLVVHPTSSVLPTNRQDSVEVTARFGWTAVPDAITQACLLQASRVFKRKEAPFGVAGSPDNNSEMRLLAKVDPDVEVIIGPYKRIWAAK